MIKQETVDKFVDHLKSQYPKLDIEDFEWHFKFHFRSLFLKEKARQNKKISGNDLDKEFNKIIKKGWAKYNEN